MLLQPDDIRRLIHYFPDKVSDRIFFSDDYDYLTLDHPVEVNISEAQFKKAANKWALYEVILPECAKRNNLGMEYEKAGDEDNAIITYESNIGKDMYPASHSYDRLLVIYRRRHDYKNERRVAVLASKIFKGEEKYAKRIGSIDALIAKQKKQ